MMLPRLGHRIAADVIVGLSVIAGFVAASHGSTPLFFATCGLLVVAAGTAGYFEPVAKRVWIHAVLQMWPELVALPFALATCRGFECGGFIAFLAMACASTVVLIVVSFVGFALRRITRTAKQW
jgi:hypothetical protein